MKAGSFRFIECVECFIFGLSCKSESFLCNSRMDLNALVFLLCLNLKLLLPFPLSPGHLTILSGTREICSTYPTGKWCSLSLYMCARARACVHVYLLKIVLFLQVSMESNGKGVSIDGVPLPFEAGEIDFGEPGTNGQHSFYQLIHQVIWMCSIETR